MRHVGLILLLGVANCRGLDPSGPVIDVSIASAALRSPTPAGERVSFYVVNRGSGLAEFEGCPGAVPARVQRLTAAGWQDHSSANIICQAIHSPSQLLLPPGDCVLQVFNWDLPGYYRIRVLYGAHKGAAQALASPYSAAFELR